MIPHEITLGPFLFRWEDDAQRIVMTRGGIVVAKIEDVYLDTWSMFVEAAHPYQGPG